MPKKNIPFQFAYYVDLPVLSASTANKKNEFVTFNLKKILPTILTA